MAGTTVKINGTDVVGITGKSMLVNGPYGDVSSIYKMSSEVEGVVGAFRVHASETPLGGLTDVSVSGATGGVGLVYDAAGGVWGATPIERDRNAAVFKFVTGAVPAAEAEFTVKNGAAYVVDMTQTFDSVVFWTAIPEPTVASMGVGTVIEVETYDPRAAVSKRLAFYVNDMVIDAALYSFLVTKTAGSGTLAAGDLVQTAAPRGRDTVSLRVPTMSTLSDATALTTNAGADMYWDATEKTLTVRDAGATPAGDYFMNRVARGVTAVADVAEYVTFDADHAPDLRFQPTGIADTAGVGTAITGWTANAGLTYGGVWTPANGSNNNVSMLIGGRKGIDASIIADQTNSNKSFFLQVRTPGGTPTQVNCTGGVTFVFVLQDVQFSTPYNPGSGATPERYITLLDTTPLAGSDFNPGNYEIMVTADDTDVASFPNPAATEYTGAGGEKFQPILHNATPTGIPTIFGFRFSPGSVQAWTNVWSGAGGTATMHKFLAVSNTNSLNSLAAMRYICFSYGNLGTQNGRTRVAEVVMWVSAKSDAFLENTIFPIFLDAYINFPFGGGAGTLSAYYPLPANAALGTDDGKRVGQVEIDSSLDAYIATGVTASTTAWTKMSSTPVTGGVGVDVVSTIFSSTVAANVSVAGGIASVPSVAKSLYVGAAGGTGLDTILYNRAASTDPTVNDDVDLGYSVGSLWINTVSNKSFACADATDGAAVWIVFVTPGVLNGPYLTDVTALPSPPAVLARRVLRFDGTNWRFVPFEANRNMLNRGLNTASINVASGEFCFFTADTWDRTAAASSDVVVASTIDAATIDGVRFAYTDLDYFVANYANANSIVIHTYDTASANRHTFVALIERVEVLAGSPNIIRAVLKKPAVQAEAAAGSTALVNGTLYALGTPKQTSFEAGFNTVNIADEVSGVFSRIRYAMYSTGSPRSAFENRSSLATVGNVDSVAAPFTVGSRWIQFSSNFEYWSNLTIEYDPNAATLFTWTSNYGAQVVATAGGSQVLNRTVVNTETNRKHVFTPNASLIPYYQRNINAFVFGDISTSTMAIDPRTEAFTVYVIGGNLTHRREAPNNYPIYQTNNVAAYDAERKIYLDVDINSVTGALSPGTMSPLALSSFLTIESPTTSEFVPGTYPAPGTGGQPLSVRGITSDGVSRSVPVIVNRGGGTATLNPVRMTHESYIDGGTTDPGTGIITWSTARPPYFFVAVSYNPTSQTLTVAASEDPAEDIAIRTYPWGSYDTIGPNRIRRLWPSAGQELGANRNRVVHGFTHEFGAIREILTQGSFIDMYDYYRTKFTTATFTGNKTAFIPLNVVKSEYLNDTSTATTAVWKKLATRLHTGACACAFVDGNTRNVVSIPNRQRVTLTNANISAGGWVTPGNARGFTASGVSTYWTNNAGLFAGAGTPGQYLDPELVFVGPDNINFEIIAIVSYYFSSAPPTAANAPWLYLSKHTDARIFETKHVLPVSTTAANSLKTVRISMCDSPKHGERYRVMVQNPSITLSLIDIVFANVYICARLIV